MTGPGAAPLSVLVADDEALARRRLVKLLSGREGVRLAGQCGTGPATVQAVREGSPDILFLDVQMPGLDGFEVLAALAPEERPVVVFSTAYDEYALAAFEVHAVDYLLKPYADERFERSLERAEGMARGRRLGEWHERLRALLDGIGGRDDAPSAPAGPGYLERFAVRRGERLTVVEAAAVDWIGAEGDYVLLHVGTDAHLVRATMAALERRLDPRRFLRIHRSTIVRLDRVRHLQPGVHGDYTATLAGGERLRVGRRYRDALLRRLGLAL